MELARSARLAASMQIMAQCPSTNAELVRHVRDEPARRWPSFSVLATDTQTGGHGRHARVWESPAGACLAASVLVRPRGPAAQPAALGWLPLAAGLAMVQAIRTLGVPAGLKWPNDVLAGADCARPGKLVGVLVELVDTPDGPATVVGTGVNLTLQEEDLPVPTASSLALCGVAEPDPDAVLAPYLAALRGLVADLEQGGAPAAGVRDAVRAACTTLGRQVRIEAPAHTVTGRAVAIDDGGRIVVEDAGGRKAVSAGDVTHLRY